MLQTDQVRVLIHLPYTLVSGNLQVSFNKQVGSEQLQYAGKTDHMWISGGIFTPDSAAGGNAIDGFLISIMDQQLQIYNKLNKLEHEMLEQIA